MLHVLGGPLSLRNLPSPLLLCVRARACAPVSMHPCIHSHVRVHSPFRRKSKIAVSLNSFPLAAQTAFVLQTKRKRNETEGSEEAGRRRERGSRGQGTNRGKGKREGRAGRGQGRGETARDRQKDRLGARRKQPHFACALCKDPGLPDTEASETQHSSPPSPPRALERCAPDG